MDAPSLRRRRSRWPLLAALVLSSATSVLLVAARVAHTRRLTYAFLVYNLALAWIPLFFALAAEGFDGKRSRQARVLTLASLGGWLVFFPNAPYIVTDVMHLHVEGNRLFWLDLTALQAAAWTGLALGYASLTVVQRLVARRAGPVASWLFVAVVLGASAFGIYLGRFRRWNSWDVLLNPWALARDVAATVLHPFANAQVVAYCAVLGGFLFTAYVVLRAWTGWREEP